MMVCVHTAVRCVSVCVCAVVVRLNWQVSHANRKSHVGAHIEEDSPVKCICASE